MSFNLDEWGMDFMPKLEEEILAKRKEEVYSAWLADDIESVMSYVEGWHPNLTEDQLDWIEQFLIELA